MNGYGRMPSFRGLGLLDSIGMGAGPAPGIPARRDGTTPGNIPLGSSFRRDRSPSRFPTKICPACGGTGKVPDMQAIRAMMGIGQSMG